MKERGRQVVPWFQTSFAIALFVAISGAMFAKVIAGDLINKDSLPESVFLIIFSILGFGVFFLIKFYFFDSEKHLMLSEIYLKNYSPKRRLIIKATSIGLLFLIPLLLGSIMWIQIM
ncbi:hypothetical protein [Mucilaginibacter pineti]|nr:hypothetical protein [Mucilaginibacter pineti]